MKKVLLFVLLLFSFIGFGQCPSEIIYLFNQDDIDEFAANYPDCTQITNGITIEGAGNPDYITNLNGLSQIESVYPFLTIKNTDNLVNLEGLNQITFARKIELTQNHALINSSGLENVQFEFLEIYRNEELLSISGLTNDLFDTARNIELRENPNLISLNGLEGVTKLKELFIRENHSLVNFSGLENLRYIGGGKLEVYQNNNLESFDGLENVYFYRFEGDWGGLIKIEYNASLTTISPDFLDPSSSMGRIILASNSSLTDLNGFSNLTYLDWKLLIRNNDELQDLSGLSHISNPQIRELTITNNDGLQNLSGLENFDRLLNDGTSFFEIDNNIVLTDISSINLHIGNLNTLTITNNPILSVCSVNNVCAHIAEGGVANVSDNAVGCNTAIEIEDSCNDYNLISGNVFFDFNLDGCDPADFPAETILVKISNGTDVFGIATDPVGQYTRAIDLEGTFQVSIAPGSIPDFFEVSPINEEVIFAGFGNESIVNFCLTATESLNDLKVTILPLNQARPGFDARYQLVYQNIGTEILDGNIELQFDDSRQNYLSSEPIEDLIIGDLISWNYTNLLPFESRIIEVSFNNNPPPINNSGDVLSFVATANPINNDINPDDNTYILNQIMVNSQDPNYKNVNQGIEIFESQVSDYLDYIIHFQNLGTASAVNVRVEDVLSEKLNWNSLRVISASHDFRLEINGDNELRFIFDGINLPTASSDPEGSNGFVAFQIKPIQNIALGDVIENTADIYFDFNDAIVTNTVSTTVVENLGVDEFSLDTLIHLYPNPISSTLNIKTSENISFEKATVYSTLGKLILETQEKQINLETLSAGIYFVEVVTDKGNVTKKIVKE